MALPQGPRLNESAGLQNGWPPKSLGCWSTYSTNTSTADAFSFYSDRSNVPGWTITEAHPESTTVNFVSASKPNFQAMVSVSGSGSALWNHPGRTRIDITVCFCDPRSFEG